MNYNNKKRKFDDVNNDHQESLFYVYESKKRSLKSNFNLNLDRDDLASSCHYDNSLKASSKDNFRLFNMCLNYVAKNLESVDCLIGFPDQVGFLLFDECVKLDKFDASKQKSSDVVKRCLSLFANAYSDRFIESISLSNKSVKTIDFLSDLIENSKLIQLDLSDTNFIKANRFNLISALESSESTLEALNLRNCNLDEDFMRTLTLRQRLNEADFRSFKYLDLSLNYKLIKHWNDKVLNYFTRFSALQTILFGYYKEDSDLVSKMRVNGKDCTYHLCKCSTVVPFEHEKFETKGLIKKLNIDKFMSDEDQHSRKQKSIEEYKSIKNQVKGNLYSLKARNFYSNPVSTNKFTNEMDYLVFKRNCKCFKANSIPKTQLPQNQAQKSQEIKSSNQNSIDLELLKKLYS